ncbi:hypothetical protein JOB18_045260, partial [Solea senegalensis]
DTAGGDFAIQFLTLVVDLGWNEPVLIDAFMHDINSRLLDRQIPLDIHDDLDSLIDLVMRLDNHLREYNDDRCAGVLAPHYHQPSDFSHRLETPQT